VDVEKVKELRESGNTANTLVGAPSAGKGISQRGWVNAGCSVVGKSLRQQITMSTCQTEARIVTEALRMKSQSALSQIERLPV
jgi:hypothetical protein